MINQQSLKYKQMSALAKICADKFCVFAHDINGPDLLGSAPLDCENQGNLVSPLSSGGPKQDFTVNNL